MALATIWKAMVLGPVDPFFTAEESARQVGRAREILKPKSVQLYLVFNSAATGISIGHSFCFLDTLAMRLGGESVF